MAPNEHALRRTTHTNRAHGASRKHAAHGVLLLSDGSPDISHIWTTPSLPKDPLEPHNDEPRSLRQPLNRSHARKIRNREMRRARIHEHDHMSKEDGPPPGPGGSNVTNHGPKRACTKENYPYK
ncbi:hypothetical protein F511_14910 [Dorcoceras hygrometricum]|uniref:Uncharacterized protein n=1 Tax=Dorcoceras hygrometricum TaxID=472368 RepID=A0A2Z7C7B5_9LAMI|nr:hypothetical protein F511_14910 [Dorcoceras hygrometricum]